MNESCVEFGEDGRLRGIVSEPEAAVPARPVTCVLVNAGLVPKFGPFRLYVDVARRLAQRGFRALRFDLGGIGESRAASSGEPLRVRTARDLDAAITFAAERHAASHVVLMGLCSGAEDSFRQAGDDARVRGVVLMDPFAYRTEGWGWRHALHRASRRALRAAGLFTPIAPAAGAVASSVVTYSYMEREESRRILEGLVARRAHVHFVYTGGMRESFNHPDQLAKMFPGLDLTERVQLDWFPAADHTQILEADRRAIADAIARRLNAAFPRA